MKTTSFIFFLIMIGLTLTGQAQVPENVCEDLLQLVDDLIPEDFEGITYQEATIEEVAENNLYRKLEHGFLGADYTYFDPEGDVNKKFRSYPVVSTSKEETATLYVELVKALSTCEIVYTSVAQPANPNVGRLASQTIGIDRRFFNSTLSLYGYESADSSRYWIEYELTAPK